jgi:hypothetical protein
MERIEREGGRDGNPRSQPGGRQADLEKDSGGVVQERIHDALARRRHCPECGKARHSKGHHDITIRPVD